MNVFSFDMTGMFGLLCVLMRISVVLFMLPVFSSNNLPIQVKAAVSLVLTLGLWPHLPPVGVPVPAHPFALTLMLLGEFVIGLVLGMSVNFFFMGIQAGGELLGFQMGFSMINFADPLTGNQTGATAFFLWMVSLLIFLALDGHLHMLRGIASTFTLIPPGGLVLGDMVTRQVFVLSAGLFLLALKIAAPVMVALFLVELALGLVARTSPQIQIMEVGFPIKIGVGFAFILLLLSVMRLEMEDFVGGLSSLLLNLIRAMSPLAG